MTYHAKIIAGGKLVIPAVLRRELGIIDGDSVVVARAIARV
jgi:AbrB family transcriptional regulator, stage V sporulation protein T